MGFVYTVPGVDAYTHFLRLGWLLLVNSTSTNGRHYTLFLKRYLGTMCAGIAHLADDLCSLAPGDRVALVGSLTSRMVIRSSVDAVIHIQDNLSYPAILYQVAHYQSVIVPYTLDDSFMILSK